MTEPAFQDTAYMQGNHCMGCAPESPGGLRIKSRWVGDESVCVYHPEAHQTAGWPTVVYGGLIASLIDCHTVCTAIAEANRETPPGGRGQYWFASVKLNVDFLRPTPVGKAMELRARIVENSGRKMRLTCSVFSEGLETARGEVTAVRVPSGGGPEKD